MIKKHILICGPVHVGKSTLINHVLADYPGKKYGYATKRLDADETGFCPIYIHPAWQTEDEKTWTDANCIGTCNRKIHNIRLDIFNTVGASLIKEADRDGIILMDEIGFMEAKADTFTEAIFNALDGDIPVIGAVKDRTDVPFLDRIRQHPGVNLFYISEENRDELYEQVRALFEKIVK